MFKYPGSSWTLEGPQHIQGKITGSYIHLICTHTKINNILSAKYRSQVCKAGVRTQMVDVKGAMPNNNLIAMCCLRKCVQLNSWMTWIWLCTKFCLSIRRLKGFLNHKLSIFQCSQTIKFSRIQVFVKGSNTSVKSRNMAKKKSSFVEDNFSLVKRLDKNLHTTLYNVLALIWCKIFKCYFTDTTLLIAVSWTPTAQKGNYLELLSVQALWTGPVRHLNTCLTSWHWSNAIDFSGVAHVLGLKCVLENKRLEWLGWELQQWKAPCICSQSWSGTQG